MSDKERDAWNHSGGEAHITAHAKMTGNFIANAYPEIVAAIRDYHPIQCVKVFSSLLGSLELQANCARLEALIHLCLRFAEGDHEPSSKDVEHWFNLMDDGPCGDFEDPAEDVFVSSVSTPFGNFRVLEGIWECGGFYLQRVLDAMYRYEQVEEPTQIARSVHALLKLTHAFCERCGLNKYDLGQEYPAQLLPSEIRAVVGELRERSTFSHSELEKLGINDRDLAPFSFSRVSTELFASQFAGHTDLESRPIIFFEDEVVFALPTATTAAIRRFLHEAFDELLRPGFLAEALALEYADLFSRTPLLGGHARPDIEFRRTKAGMLAGVTKRIDLGRYINIVFVHDGLDGFEQTGLLGADPDPNRYTEDIDTWIDFSYDQVSKEADFLAMTTIVVVCGIGRAIHLTASAKSREAWRFVFVDAADFYTLSLVKDFSPQTLWRILDVGDMWRARGVEHLNANGLLNLVAWTQKLAGHMVPHPLFTEEGDEDYDRLLMMVDQNALLGLRHETISQADEHRLLDVHGVYRPVIRRRSSFFEADAQTPIYYPHDIASLERLEQVYESERRAWWCIIEATVEDQFTELRYVYSWFELMRTWLPRLAPALDEVFLELKDKALCLAFKIMPASVASAGNSNPISLEEACGLVAIQVEPNHSTIEICVQSGFERALSAVDNRAERAIIQRIINGTEALSGTEIRQAIRDDLLADIIPSDKARQSHRFESDNFRDRMRERADRPSVKPDPIDEGALKIGLGWRIRDRSEGSRIEGVEACRDYLNALSGSIVDELREMLRHFDRRSVIGHCLFNHECSAIERARWQRTSAAIEALRKDEADVRQKIVERHHEMNGVSQGSRQLVELAICECPLEGGQPLGDIDLSRLLCRMLLAVHFSAAADAIHKGAMTSVVQILPLGDVVLDNSFHEQVVLPHAVNLANSNIDAAIANQAENYQLKPADPDTSESEVQIDPAFERAFKAELGVNIFEARIFVEHLENVAYIAGTPVIFLDREKILSVETELYSLLPEVAQKLVQSWTLAPRSSWAALEQEVKPRDLYVGRFRRQISMLRKPLILIDPDRDLFMICPGIIRDAFEYQVRHFFKGDYRATDIRSPEMKAWKSKVDGEKGQPFEKEVKQILEDAGWETRHSVNVTEIFGRKLDRDYGEIDILAWRKDTQQILIVECKNLVFRQSPGELAEQLSDFQGISDERGKPDLLFKHLNRVGLLKSELEILSKFCGMDTCAKLRDALVFSVPVPMMFERSNIPEPTEVLLIDDLNQT